MGAILRFFLGLWLLYLPVHLALWVFADNSTNAVSDVNVRELLEIGAQQGDFIFASSQERADAMRYAKNDKDYREKLFSLSKDNMKKAEVNIEKSIISSIEEVTKNNVILSWRLPISFRGEYYDLISAEFNYIIGGNKEDYVLLFISSKKDWRYPFPSSVATLPRLYKVVNRSEFEKRMGFDDGLEVVYENPALVMKFLTEMVLRSEKKL